MSLLARLRDGQGAFLQAALLGDHPSRLRSDLDELEAFGYAIERHPDLGVAYRGPAARLCPDQIEWELGTKRVGRRVAVWSRVTSTNDLASRAAGSTANDGLVILAEEQTAGRGRRGRSWTAPPGSSILMSILLFPPSPLADSAWLTALGAVAVAEVVDDWGGLNARIKWPNDVRVDGRKLAGVLVERGPGSVLGIGLNVEMNHAAFPVDLRHSVTSLRAFSTNPIDRSELARCLIRRLDALYDQGIAEGPGPLSATWRERLEFLGRLVCVETATGAIAGRLVDADLLRGLTVATAEGHTRTVLGTEVLAVSPPTDRPGSA